jgi:NAD(P)H-binding/Protein of unknown function (DUF4242)
MPKYVIERDIPGAGNVGPEEVRSLSEKNNGVIADLGDVQWVQSYVTGDTLFCGIVRPRAPLEVRHRRRLDRRDSDRGRHASHRHATARGERAAHRHRAFTGASPPAAPRLRRWVLHARSVPTLTRSALRSQYRDLAAMGAIARDSGLDWTIVRPPRLTDKPRTGRYRTACGQNIRRGLLISRADVADLMLRVSSDPGSIHQVVGVAS